MRYSTKQICFQEVPNEVSLSFMITGCKLKCKGCHSAGAWQGSKGIELTEEHLISLLDRYDGLLTCVLFLGGEWDKQELIKMLTIARGRRLNTCLYTGEIYEDVDDDILNMLDYIKTGPYIEELGGLDSPTTNQKFQVVASEEDITHYFNNNK